jgi:archaellin
LEGIGVLIAFVLVAAFFVVVILPIVALVRARGASENAALLRS